MFPFLSILGLAGNINVISEDNLINIIPSLGPEFRITFGLLFNCFEEPLNHAASSNILTFQSGTSSKLSLDLFFREKVLQLTFNGIPTKRSPPGVFTNKVWYEYLIVQEKKGNMVKQICTCKALF